eukprot:jgi/Chlat1/4279/Chrsp29S04368
MEAGMVASTSGRACCGLAGSSVVLADTTLLHERRPQRSRHSQRQRKTVAAVVERKRSSSSSPARVDLRGSVRMRSDLLGAVLSLASSTPRLAAAVFDQVKNAEFALKAQRQGSVDPKAVAKAVRPEQPASRRIALAALQAPASFKPVQRQDAALLKQPNVSKPFGWLPAVGSVIPARKVAKALATDDTPTPSGRRSPSANASPIAETQSEVPQPKSSTEEAISWVVGQLSKGVSLVLPPEESAQGAQKGFKQKTNAPVSPPAIAPLRHAMRHAFAAYGNTLKDIYMGIASNNLASQLYLKLKEDLSLVASGGVAAAERHTAAAAAVAGLQLQDIVLSAWSPDLFCPCAYVGVDHSQKWVVVAVRGSLDNADWLTDLSADSVPFLNGWAHRGMVAAARRLAESHLPAVASALDQNPGYELVITGHSLGAGVASLLAMLLHENDYGVISSTFQSAKSTVRIPPQKNWALLERLTNPRCFAYAPPSIVSLPLAQNCSSYVTSIVCGDDVVPSLSIGNLQFLVSGLQGVLPMNLSGLVEAFSSTMGFSGKPTLKSEVEGAKPDDAEEAAAATLPKSMLRDHNSSDFLCPPGMLVHVLNPNSDGPTASVSEPTKFSEIKVSSNMISDHLPGVYMTALQRMYVGNAVYGSTVPDDKSWGGEFNLSFKLPFFA